MKKRILALFMALLMIVSVVMPVSSGNAEAKEDFAGYVYFTVEKFTLGQGFVIEPVKAGFYADDTLADITERVLGDKSTFEGDISSYYLASVIDGGEPEGWTKADIPAKILEAAGGEAAIKGRNKATELAAFDYYSMSGWMFSLNNVGIAAGAGSYRYNSGSYSYQDGDVVRLQYSVYGYGQDLNTFDESWGMGKPLADFPDKDALIKAVADYTGDKNTEAYKDAMKVLSDWNASYDDVKAALKAIAVLNNHAPNIRSNVKNNDSVEINSNEIYNVDLSTVFEDKDKDPLTYWVSVNGAAAKETPRKYEFYSDKAEEYTLSFKAYDGISYSEEYVVKVKVNDTEGEKSNVSITINSNTPFIKLTDSNGRYINTGTPSGNKYNVMLSPGHYVVTGIDKDGATVNGTIGIDVTGEAEQNFNIFTVTVSCSNSAWKYGTDFDFRDLNVQSKNAQKRTDITLGDTSAGAGKKTFLVFSGDTYGFWFTPSEELHGDYAETFQTGTVTNNASKNISPAVKCPLNIVIPYADTDKDGVNDYELEVGTLNTYYIYTYNSCADSEVIYSDSPENTYGYDVAVYTYNAAKNTTYFYRVSNPYDNDVVTYGDYVMVRDETTVNVTKDNLRIGTSYNKDTVIDDLSVNKYDVADIYLNINEKGYINMEKGDTYNLYPLRNWLAVESFMNSKVIEPDFHYTVLDENGMPSDSVVRIKENTSETTSRHRGEMEAVGEGTAIVLVTYDAMTNAQGYAYSTSTDRTFFSAIWPENTGVFVVTVGADTGIETGMKINETNTVDTKLSGEYIDSEHDVLYYTGDKGASYTFTPEAGTIVTVASPQIDSKVSYKGFNSSKVTYNADGSVTLNGLKEGSSIVRLKKDGKTEYQIIRAKQLSYTVTATDADGNPVSDSKVNPGDKVTVVFDKVYHPANKLSGYYNNTAQIVYKDENGNDVKGASNQYTFADSEKSQTVSFTVPENWSADKYKLTKGYVITGGFGSAFGAHRYVTYEGGKPADFTARMNVSKLGGLPDVIIDVNNPSQDVPENPLSDDSEEIRNTVLRYIHTKVEKPVINSIGGEWAVLSLARGEVTDEDWYTSYYNYVLQAVKANGSAKLSNTKSTENSRVIIGLTSIGADPENVSGYNLLEPLSDLDYVTSQGINGAIYALIALDTNKYDIPKAADGVNQTTRQNLIDFILGRQLEDSGWALTGTEADTDITAMAIQSLAPYYNSDDRVKMAVDKAIDRLSQMQRDDGGYSSWNTVNSESAAQVVCALSIMGINPDTDERFVKNGNSVLDALLSYFDSTTGGFLHTADGTVNQMATEQAAYALDAYYRMMNSMNTLYDMGNVNKLYNSAVNNTEQTPGETEKPGETTGNGTAPSGTTDVNTGDSMNPAMYIVIMMAAILASAAIVAERKKSGSADR